MAYIDDLPDFIEFARVVEVISDPASGKSIRGSGYQISETVILTAAHVVAGFENISIRFLADTSAEWTAIGAKVWLAAPKFDISLVLIEPPPGRQRRVADAKFGRLPSRAAVIRTASVGFPLFKLRADTDSNGEYYRDSHHAVGTIATLSNQREGTLEVAVSSPAPCEDPKRSPWEGMSGAALWIGDRIVGVVTRHYQSDGLGKLTAARIDKLADHIRTDDASTSALDIAPALRNLLDVSPNHHRSAVLTTYRLLVQDIAPDELIDRQSEYDTLVRFCAGCEPFLWWQAGPWAGKSALMSWFVLHPPQYVDVVSFFVTGRLVGQDNSDAFTDAIIEQLAAIADESTASVLSTAARRGAMLRLFEAAAARLEEADRRLTVVVDGLDEDSGPRGEIHKPSILSLLPRRLPSNVRMVLASRPDPPIPDDVPPDHPLRKIKPLVLMPSPYARHVEINAKNEMQRLLDGSPLQRELLGLITACGGGLTKQDLEALTNRKLYEIDRLLSGIFGRTVGSRRLVDRGDGRSERVYLFKHETIRAVALDQFGSSGLAEYHDKISAWADQYQYRGWPADTPSYLLRGYQQMLAGLNDSARLTTCATDELRHDAMLRATGGDALALTEVRTARELELQSPDPDIGAILLLAAHRDHLVQRNSRLPIGLPGLWAMLGQPARGEALATPIMDPIRSALALARLAESSAIAGDQSRAIELAWQAKSALEIAQSLDAEKDRAREAVAKALGVAQQTLDAEQVINTISTPARRVRAMAKLAEAASIRGDEAWAVALASVAEDGAGYIDSQYLYGDTLASLIEVYGRAGDNSRAEDLLSLIKSTIARADALARLADIAAQAGEFARAEETLGRIELKHILSDSVARFGAAAVREGRVNSFISRVADPSARIIIMTSQCEALAKAGFRDRAIELWKEARTTLDRISDAERRAEYAVRLAFTAVKLGDVERASELAHVAEALTRGIVDQAHRRSLLRWLIVSVAAVGDIERTERLALRLDDPLIRAEALAQLVRTFISRGDTTRVEKLLLESERSFSEVPSRSVRDDGFSDLAEQYALLGNYAYAERLVSRIGIQIGTIDLEVDRYGGLYGPDSRGEAERVAEAFLRVARAARSRTDSEHVQTYTEKAKSSADQIHYPTELPAYIHARTVQLINSIRALLNDESHDVEFNMYLQIRGTGRLGVASSASADSIMMQISGISDWSELWEPDPQLQASLRLGRLNFSAVSAADDPIGKDLMRALATVVLHIDSSPNVSPPSRGKMIAYAKSLAAATLGTPSWIYVLPIMSQLAPTAVLQLADELPGQGWRNGDGNE